MENHSELTGHQCPVLVEHIVEILSRLPVKSLIRFKCVSQSWRSLISSTEFIALHTNKVLDDKEFFFRSRRVFFNGRIDDDEDMVVDPGQYGPFSIDLDQFLQNHSDDNTCTREITLNELGFIRDNIVLAPRGYSFDICFCINLLLCRTEYAYYLVNPANRDMMKLPNTPNRNTSAICGLGFDYLTNDYKVIDVDTERRVGRNVVYHVYSTKTNSSSWRQIECHSAYVPCLINPAGIFLNGDIHWIGHSVNGKSRILSFVVAEERFYEIELPKNTHYLRVLGVFRDCLAITFVSMDGVAYDEFWVMKDYKVSESWTKMHIFTYTSWLSPFGFSTKTHDVMVYNNSFCMYECGTELQARNIPRIGDLVGVYVEGLFPLADRSSSVSHASYSELQGMRNI